MQRIVKEIPRNCQIIFMGDTHGGSLLTNYDGLSTVIEYIGSSKNCFWEHGGDWIEAITSDDRRFQADHLPLKTPKEQADEMIRYFRPIRKKGIVGLGGNHEQKLNRIENFAETICDSLEIPYGTRTSRIIFNNNGKHLFNAFVTHDIQQLKSNAKEYIQAEANIKAALKKYLYKRMGDCTVMIAHHTHQLIIVPPSPQLYLVDGEYGVKQHYLTGDMGVEHQYIDHDRRWYGSAGNFRKRFVDGIDDYSDIYDPNEMGCLEMVVRGGRIEDIVALKV